MPGTDVRYWTSVMQRWARELVLKRDLQGLKSLRENTKALRESEPGP